MAYTKKKVEASIGVFIQQYRRKSDRHIDPNDRQYDRVIEKIIKRMKPEELSRMMYDEDGDGKDE